MGKEVDLEHVKHKCSGQMMALVLNTMGTVVERMVQ